MPESTYWPSTWPSTPDWQRADRTGDTYNQARDALVVALQDLGAQDTFLSTSGGTDPSYEPTGPAVALWFVYGGTSYVLACDRYRRSRHNLRVLANVLRDLVNHRAVMGEAYVARFLRGFESPDPHPRPGQGQDRAAGRPAPGPDPYQWIPGPPPGPGASNADPGGYRDRVSDYRRGRRSGRAYHSAGFGTGGARAGSNPFGRGSAADAHGARSRQEEQQRESAQGFPGPGPGFPNMGPPPWCAVLGFAQPPADLRAAERAYRQRVRTAHPDVGGSEAAMRRLNEAIEQARAWYA